MHATHLYTLRFKPLNLAIIISIYAMSGASVAAETTKKKDVVDLGTTVVTGQKIDRSRQDTVDSVKVFDGYELEERAKADDFYDLLNQTANVVQDRSTAFQIRGISTTGATNASDGGSTIGLFVDDAVIGRRAGQDGALSLWDVEQVEVLRGSQSTTSGRNSLAGAFVIKTKDPEFVSNGKAKLGYGSDNTYQAAIAQTGPITNKLAYRIAVDHRHSDNHVTNTFFNKKDWDEESSSTVRGKLKYKINKDSDVLFSVSHNTFDDQGDDSIRENLRPKQETLENHLSTWKTKSNNVSLKYNTPISDSWKLTSTTTHSRSHFDRDSDADGATGNSLLIQDTRERDTTQEFLFNYQQGKTKAAIGLYVAKGELDDQYQITDFLFPLKSIESQLPQQVKDGLAAQNVDLAQLPPARLFVDVGTKETYQNAAMFFNADYNITPNLTLITGLRLDHETRTNDIVANGTRAASTGIPTIDGLIDQLVPRLGGSGDGKRSSTNVLPKLGFDYAWNNTLNTGLIVQRGYRPGGISVNSVRGQATEYEPEFTTNYELSLRKRSADKKLNLNANLFYTDWKDQQVRFQLGSSQFDTIIKNAAKSHISGLELEGSYQATDNLSLNANLGYTKTEFDDFTFRGLNLKGKEFPRARKWTAGVGGNYTHPQGFFLNTQLNYADDGFNNQANTTTIDDFLLWNMKIGYDAESWRPSLYFRNILNQKYVTERYTRQGNINQVVLGAPFTFGANVEFFW